MLLRQKLPAGLLFLLLAKLKTIERGSESDNLPSLCHYHEHDQSEEAEIPQVHRDIQ